MQKGVRFNEGQLLYLASKARNESTMSGFLSKKSSDTGKWQLRYFVLYQNMLFYFENETSSRPSGVALMEGSYCERVITPVLVHKGKDSEKQYCFTITYRSEGQRQYDLRSESESECKAWIDVLQRASYSKVQELKEELEQKHLHLLQILDSERKAKWHYVQQTEELATEVKKLKAELQTNQKENLPADLVTDETDEIKKIKKVQSFFRGWLCRRRWKQIVELYIRSPHAESMRKRNSIVFNMVECEEEYNRQLSCLVTYYLRPLRMAASSKKPPISHEDVNSIFLNSETLLFLHQIFLKGLTARLENWPTLVLGDLFDMLLPMLNIYQEYVRNHHYSLQVLSEYKQRPEFGGLLRRYEEKPACEGRTLETFLTYPMHQIPRYIITLHELLAHTPHEHVERRSLEFAKGQLEELSKVMHDEVSETENIRKNLSIERMIVEGCDILLDVNQTFIRQGPLLQVILERGKSNRGRLGSFNTSFKESRKEAVRQVFLFTNHILLTARASNGRLHLVKTCGKIPLTDCTLIEDPASDVFFFDEETSSLDSNLSLGSHSSASNLPCPSALDQGKMNDYNGFDFRLIVDSKSGPPTSIYLVASTLHEKSAWCSDIGQCIENLLYSDLLNSSTSESSSVTMPQSVRTDPKLFRDDVDIKFSRTLNSCKVPQIRHASVDRLLERLTDLRFLSIDFLNTFLLTYRVFTTGSAILESLRNVYKNPETTESPTDIEDSSASPPTTEFTNVPPDATQVVKPQAEKTQAERRMSKCGVNEVLPEVLKFKDPVGNITGFLSHVEVDRVSPSGFRYERTESMESDDSRPELANYLSATKHKLAPIASFDTLCDVDTIVVPAITTDDSYSSGMNFSRAQQGSLQDICDEDLECKLVPPIHSRVYPCSLDTSLPVHITSPNTVSSAASSDTLTPGTPRLSPIPFLNGSQRKVYQESSVTVERHDNGMFRSYKGRERNRSLNIDALALSSSISVLQPRPASSSPVRAHSPFDLMLHKHAKCHSQGPSRSLSPTVSPKLRRAPSPISFSYSSPNIVTPQIKVRPFSGKSGGTESESVTMSTPRGSLVQIDGSPPTAKPGTVVTSSRASKRRSSSSAATTAFAAATAGAGLPSCPDENLDDQGTSRLLFVSSDMHSPQKRDSVIFTAATMRVLNVIKHWVSKHQLDFESDPKLKESVITTLEEMQNDSNLLPSEHKAASSILRTINKETSTMSLEELTHLLSPPKISSKDNFDSLSALDIAEQLTFLDHKIFMSISSEELLSQAWMKPDKSNKAVHVLLVSKRFNEVSRLVVSEVVRRPILQDRVACIEKWAAIADICRCMHNYNGVLQICAAFVNSSVYRLKKTWEKMPKQTKQMIDKLQILVSSEGRFKNMREALHRCDPPCIPYLGMYLTDLSFIEEGTPNFTDDGLVNFSKMRMIAHVIREIQLFQHIWYKIEHHPRVTAYLLDPSNLLDEERTYRASLDMEPKHSRLSVVSAPP